MRLPQAGFGHHVEGTDHAYYRAEQSEQRGKRNDGIENAEAAFEYRNLGLGRGFHRLGRRGIAVCDAGRQNSRDGLSG